MLFLLPFWPNEQKYCSIPDVKIISRKKPLQIEAALNIFFEIN